METRATRKFSHAEVFRVGRTTMAAVNFMGLTGTGSTCRRLEDREDPVLAERIAMRRALADLEDQLAKEIKRGLRRNCGGHR